MRYNLIIIITILVIIGILSYALYIQGPGETKQVIENYKYIPKNYEKRVLVSIINTDTDFNFEEFLKSVLYQSKRVDNIDMNIPKLSEKKHPKEIVEMVISVYKLGNDMYEPRNNIIPTLKRYGDKNTLIIFLRDDRTYNYGFIEGVIDKLKNEPSRPVVDDLDFEKTGVLGINLDYVDIDIIEKMSTYNSMKNYLGEPVIYN